MTMKFTTFALALALFAAPADAQSCDKAAKKSCDAATLASVEAEKAGSCTKTEAAAKSECSEA